MTTNWAGNISYAAAQVARPHTVAEVQELVAGADRVRAIGSGHTFNDLPDTDGVLVTLADVPFEPVLDTEQRQVTVGSGARYGDLAELLEPAGWAWANLASLPHISVVGAVMTGTHESGVGNRGPTGPRTSGWSSRRAAEPSCRASTSSRAGTQPPRSRRVVVWARS